MTEHCLETKTNHPWLGFIKLHNNGHYTDFHCNGTKHIGVSELKERNIARHHWPFDFMKRKGIKSCSATNFDRELIVLPEMKGEDGSATHIATLLSRNEIMKHGTCDSSDKYSNENNKNTCCQALLMPMHDVSI